MLPSLKELTDSSLLDSVKDLKRIEDKTLADLILYLAEVDARKLYREAGYSSLFTYCTEGLGYSGASAYRRIQAARSLETNPEVYGLIRDGKLSLCAVAEISKVSKVEDKTQLIETCQGKAKAEVQKMVVQYQAPVSLSKRERVTPRKVIVETPAPLFSGEAPTQKEEVRFTFTVEVDAEFMELLKEAGEVAGFVPPVEVLKRSMREFINKKKAAPKVVKQVEPKVSRYIPKAVAHTVRNRDSHQCSFVSSEGKRCSERCCLEFDHIKPFALGGTNEASNLRLLCSAHNQLAAERVFGRGKIESYFHRGSKLSTEIGT